MGNVLKTCSSLLLLLLLLLLFVKPATSPVPFLHLLNSASFLQRPSHPRLVTSTNPINMDMGTASMATSAMTATATDMASMASMASSPGAAGGDMGGMDMMGGGCKISVRPSSPLLTRSVS